jgi:hypothetical protein
MPFYTENPRRATSTQGLQTNDSKVKWYNFQLNLFVRSFVWLYLSGVLANKDLYCVIKIQTISFLTT